MEKADPQLRESACLIETFCWDRPCVFRSITSSFSAVSSLWIGVCHKLWSSRTQPLFKAVPAKLTGVCFG